MNTKSQVLSCSSLSYVPESAFPARRLKGLRCATASALIGLMLALGSGAAEAGSTYSNNIMVPDIGTAGSLGISVQREMALGDYFMRTARANMPVVDDPVLNEYVKTLGNRLLAHADGVQFPFDFFVVADNNLNAAAFLGGKVAINTGLFNYAETEDEFASVIAHEISHVTQRHIARFIESMTQANQLSTAAIIGSIVMSIVNPALGMAAVSTTMGASMQSRINFTRDNEFEADRIGIALMYKAGLNPEGTVDMFRRLAAMQGNINPAFTLLLDHPLSDVRMAEAQNRVLQYEKRASSRNPDYEMARARILVRYSNYKNENSLKVLKERLSSNVDNRSEYYRNYALALICFELKEYNESRQYLDKLDRSLQHNLFVEDLMTDLDIKQGQAAQAIARLQKLYQQQPLNQTIVANLVTAYEENKQYSRAKQLLDDYLRQKPKDVLALSLLEQVQSRLRDRCNAYQTRGEIYALGAAYAKAIGSYNNALKECENRLTRERIKARVSEIVMQRSFDEELLSR